MEIKDLLIEEDCTLLEAMALLDKVSRKILFVVRQDKLVEALTDGDIRRWILKKGELNATVKDIANYQPKYLREEDKLSSKEYMKQNSIEAIPILSADDEVISITFINDEEIEKKNSLNIPVVMMAGGYGTRLYPYTKILPKPLIPIGEIPIAEHIINRFNNDGCNDFFLIVNHKKNMIKAYFNEIKKNYSITFIDEKKPLGTGGGLSLLKGIIDSTFILSNCDILIQEDYGKIFKFHKEKCNLITMVCSLKRMVIPYGIVEIGQYGILENMQEKPELSFLVNTGMYIVEPKVIQDLSDDQIADFPDIIEQYNKAGEKIGIYPIGENNWMDMGQLDEMEEMKRKLEL